MIYLWGLTVLGKCTNIIDCILRNDSCIFHLKESSQAIANIIKLAFLVYTTSNDIYENFLDRNNCIGLKNEIWFGWM